MIKIICIWLCERKYVISQMLNDKIESEIKKKEITVVEFIVSILVSVFADKESNIEYCNYNRIYGDL